MPHTRLVDLTGADMFADGITLWSVNLRVGNDAALGTGTLTVNGGTLGTTAATTVADVVTLDADLVYSGSSSLTLTGAVGQSGTRGLTLSPTTATTTLTLRGANTDTGPTAAINPLQAANGPVAGSLTVSGANGSAALASGFTFNGGGTLTPDDSAAGANNNDRGDAAPVTISAGTELVTYGPNGVRPLLLASGEFAAALTSGTTMSDNVRLAVTAPTQANAVVIATPTPFTGSVSTPTAAAGTVPNTSAAPGPGRGGTGVRRCRGRVL